MKSVACLALSLSLLFVGGCTFGGSPAPREELADASQQIGNYSEPPRAIAIAKTKPALVIEPLKIDATNTDPQLGQLSADALYDLLGKTGRFDLSKREAFTKATTGSGAPSHEEAALAKEAKKVGAVYLVMGRVVQLSVAPVTDEGWLKNTFSGKYNPNDPQSKVDVTVEVELRFILADTDSVRETAKGMFTRQAKAQDLQIKLEGYVPTDTRRLQVPSESQVQLVRYGLDKAIRKALPNLDQMILVWTFDNGF